MRRHRLFERVKHTNADAEKRRLRAIIALPIYRHIPTDLRAQVQTFLALPRARVRGGMLVEILMGLRAYRRKMLGYTPTSKLPDAS